MTPDQRIAERAALVAQLRQQVTALLVENQELRGQVAKDSHKPPTSDGLQRRPRRPRQTSGRKSGGQLGQRGETLPLVATPDEVVTHQPTACAHCQTALEGTALEGMAPQAVERRQVLDRPPVRLPVSAQRSAQVQPAGASQRPPFPPRAPPASSTGPPCGPSWSTSSSSSL